MKLYIRALVVLCLTVFSFSLGILNSKELVDDCEKFSKTSELESCYINLYKKSDQNLNGNYLGILTKLKSKKGYQLIVQSFISEQRAWLKFRDQKCIFATNLVQNGRESGIVHYSCLFTVTEERNKEFIEYKQNPAIY